MWNYRQRFRTWLNRQSLKNWSAREIRRAVLFASGSVLAGTVCIALAKTLTGFPPLLLYAATVGVAVLRMGLGAGLLTLLLAILSSDFFFVDPVLTFSFNERVLILSLNYIVGAGAALLISDAIGRQIE